MLEHPGIKECVSTCPWLSSWLGVVELSRRAFWGTLEGCKEDKGTVGVCGAGREGGAGLRMEVRDQGGGSVTVQGHTAGAAETGFDLRSD